MISLHNVSGAGHALQYFAADNYYTQDEGLEHSAWFGKGAAALGLTGQVDKDEFFKTLNGEVQGQQLGKWVVNEKTGVRELDHRPGLDMTFSAPKSVSLLAEVAGNRDVRLAHEAAVGKALAYVESELAHARVTEGGVTEPVRTGNLVAALFRHNTSRDLDPQTHTHAVVMNATMRADGAWRSLTNEEIYNAQRVIGAIYNAELADQLQGLGYRLTRSDEKGNFEVEGISRAQVEHFSQRRAEIKASLEARGIDINFATQQQKEDATLMTRAHKTAVDHGDLITDWKDRARDLGIDLDGIIAKAEAQRAMGSVNPPDKITGREAVSFAAAHLIEREAVVSKNAMLGAALEHGAGRVSPTEVQKAFDKLAANGDLVKLPDGNFTTKRMLGSEMWALEQVTAQKGQSPGILDGAATLERVALAERKQNFSFTEGQKQALVTALTSEDRYVAVQGLAGTGKTTMVKALREIVQENGYTVRGMAPTGAASKVLARETGVATDTVSMFLIKERQLQKDYEFVKPHAPGFVRKPEVWIVDESSFLSQRQKAQIDHMAEKSGARVVYLGDRLQLQAVEAGKPFEMAQKGGITTAHMTEISRQQTAPLIEAVGLITGRGEGDADRRITDIELKHNARAFEFMDQQGMVREVKGKDGELVAAVVGDILKLSRIERDRTIVITPYNEDRKAINAGVREGLKASGDIVGREDMREILTSKGWTRPMLKEAQYYKAGDVVRFGRDYLQIEAKKGEYLRVAAVDARDGVVTLTKPDGSTLAWQPAKHNKVEVYEADQRPLAQGDLIRMTRNQGELKNGEIGRITALMEDHATISVKEGARMTEHRVNLSTARHWDHAYASTVHASQGATQHRTIFHIRAPESDSEFKQAKQLEGMAKVFGDRSFYVASTRASHELSIYTNDKALAARAVGMKQDKTSAVESIQKAENHRPRKAGVDL